MLQPRQAATLPPLHLLEMNIISAQDLHPVTRNMQTYAVGWVQPRSKLSTRVDPDGHSNPTWNDKFVFRIDDDFLRSETSAVMIEISCVRFFRDATVGSVRVLLSSLFPPSSLPPPSDPSSTHQLPTRFVALQVRRPSGRPQGILNIGVALLDGSMRSMTLYSHVKASAVAYWDLMGEPATTMRDQRHHHRRPLLRTKSEMRSELGDDLPPFSIIETSELPDKASVWSDSELGPSPSVVAAKLAADEMKSVIEELRAAVTVAKERKEVVEVQEEEEEVVEEPKEEEEEEVAPAPEAVVTREASTLDEYEVGSSVLEDWSVPSQGGKEDLKMKLERWRAELPTIYDPAPAPVPTTAVASYGSEGTTSRHSRRSKTDGGGGGGGLFSCFGDSYGCECSIFCGLNPRKKGAAPAPAKLPVVASDPNMARTFALE